MYRNDLVRAMGCGASSVKGQLAPNRNVTKNTSLIIQKTIAVPQEQAPASHKSEPLFRNTKTDCNTSDDKNVNTKQKKIEPCPVVIHQDTTPQQDENKTTSSNLDITQSNSLFVNSPKGEKRGSSAAPLKPTEVLRLGATESNKFERRGSSAVPLQATEMLQLGATESNKFERRGSFNISSQPASGSSANTCDVVANHLVESLTTLSGFLGPEMTESHIHSRIHSKSHTHKSSTEHSNVVGTYRSNENIAIVYSDSTDGDPSCASTSLLPSTGILSDGLGVSEKQFSKEDISDQFHEEFSNCSLHGMMKLACAATDNSTLCDIASNATAMHLQRTMCFATEQRELLKNIVSNLNELKYLNISNNNAGPAAFRAMIAALGKYDCVQQLDVSDNMADAECAECVGNLILNSKRLHTLILSGNQLGKESLSKNLSISIQHNSNLVHLNISGCGATNLHGLFEALRTGCLQGSSCLKFLDVSNNNLNDGHQLGVDLALVLESSKCLLSHLNITNTGLTSLGWEPLITAFKGNNSLVELQAGGSSNSVKNVISIANILFSNNCLTKVNISGIKLEEELVTESISFDTVNFVSDNCLREIDISNCQLEDNFFVKLSDVQGGKLNYVVSLNISGNCDITSAGLQAIEQLCNLQNENNVKSLNLSSLDLDCLSDFLKASKLKPLSLVIRKCRISYNSLFSLLKIPSQFFQEIIFDGIKLSRSNVLATLFESGSQHCFTKISLSGCALTDADIAPLVTAAGRKGQPIATLKHLDISVNRLSTALAKLSSALLMANNHPLEYLFISNNSINDEGACAFAECLASTTCVPELKRFVISHNNLSAHGIEALVNSLKTKLSDMCPFSIDVSNQKNPLTEQDMESVIHALAISIGMDASLLSVDKSKISIPQLSHKFHIDLSKLGGSAGPMAKKLDSVAIKTDFSKVCNTNASFTDYLLVSAGLQHDSNEASSAELVSNNVKYTAKEWSSIIGQNSPAWLNVDNEVRNGVYISHLPGTATLQRLEGMLEMEADCVIKDIYLIKDPILRQPTGAAWVLFANSESVDRAIQWYSAGEAQMYGTPFCISSLPVSLSDVETGAEALAKRDKLAREKQMDEEERNMMEASQQVAEERAAYREAHPAYQNGRIW